MRRGHLEALAPVCPRCLHREATRAPLRLAHVGREGGGHVIQGILHCSAPSCWQEYPVIDGVPILVPDPGDYVARMAEQILARDDLDPLLASLVGDALGPGSGHDTTRQHLSLYAGAHFGDWAGLGGTAEVARTVAQGLGLAQGAPGPALDLGASVGRGVWALGDLVPGPVLGGDLNFAMARLGQRLLREGRAAFERRRGGLVYDRVEIVAPGDGARLDLWVMDSLAPPFADASFGTVTAINLIDCLPDPTRAVHEIARLLRPGGTAVLATPYDWAGTATPPAAWLGGHSQRGPGGGASPPILRATLAAAGLSLLAEVEDLPWHLSLHDRARMTYTLHLVAARRGA